eukprot:Opistho-2@57425
MASIMMRRLSAGARVNLGGPLHTVGRRCTASLTGKQNPKTMESNILGSSSIKEGATIVEGFNHQGFTVGGIKHIGSVALFPRFSLLWKVSKVADISEDTLSLFTKFDPPIEILVIGTGSTIAPIDPKIRAFLTSKRIAVEVLDTGNACATFNFLSQEGRVAGAALIPPGSPRPDDSAST